MKNKKAAMELTMGTLVTIVLLVMVLILGGYFVNKIFHSAIKVADMTDEQLTNEINKLFTEESKLIIYPSTKIVKIKQEDVDEVGIGVKNLIAGGSESGNFSYQIVVADASDCRESDEEVAKWIIVGEREDNIPIPAGELSVQRVRFRIPSGSSLCIARFRVNVFSNGQSYSTDSFDVEIKPK